MTESWGDHGKMQFSEKQKHLKYDRNQFLSNFFGGWILMRDKCVFVAV